MTANEIEQEMDDDVATDDGIMWNAKTTCWTDITDMFKQLKKHGAAEVCHNKEIMFRIRFNQSYTRAGRFKEYSEPPSGHDEPDLATQLQQDLQRRRSRRLNSMARFDRSKHDQSKRGGYGYDDLFHF